MLPEAVLHIRLTRGAVQAGPGEPCLNTYRGGPESLLAWLETQLGLPCANAPDASRITEYANALEAVPNSTFTTSMATDRWATASELLSRRDELLLAGWDEADHELLPQLTRDLSRVASVKKLRFLGEAERLTRIATALEAGQTLPSHRCFLYDEVNSWPSRWRTILSKLTVAVPPESRPQAPEGTSLNAAQAVVRGFNASHFEQDSTFRYVVTRSETAACEFIAASLANAPDTLSETVIYCEDDHVAVRLDACLQRMGLPTIGASAISRAHPVLQVLPLTLSLSWEPVDPQVLLGFLTLPVAPLPRRVAAQLADSLSHEPGLGSSRWEKVVSDLCRAENDPEGTIRKRLDSWLFIERLPRGKAISAAMVAQRCGLVAQWASGRAIQLRDDPHAPEGLSDALQIAAGQASLLGELVQSQGAELSEPQLGRLLDEALAAGINSTPCMEADGGPQRVRSLADIVQPYKRLIWLGVGTADAAGCRWAATQLAQLRAAGLDVDDGSRQLSSLRAAEARGFSLAENSLLAVLIPKNLEQRWHPLWLAVRTRLIDCENPPVLEDLVSADNGTALSPVQINIREYEIQPRHKARSAWIVPPNSLRDRTTVSATELQDRLACPLKWVLTYQAKLRPSPIADLPDMHQLKGTFCHSVLERVFGSEAPLPSVSEAIDRVRQVFDERLPRDAAPLAQPDRLIERQKLRDDLVAATRVLVESLTAAGYRTISIEVELSGQAFDKTLCGSIDCVATHEDGGEAIVDFKYAGRNKYRDMIADGKAVQLATYAYARSPTTVFPAVAYLILSDAQLLTLTGSRFGEGRLAIDGPSIQQVWQQFSDAITAADGWLAAGEPIPARPLQSTAEWPRGASIVLDLTTKEGQQQPVCRYCDYKLICGLQETL